MIAALYVLENGPYVTPGFDVWGVTRDARLYNGPWPVIAHPPCKRWGRYWSGGPSARARATLGDDQGCFAAALHSVRLWGGVLEHPEASHAWTWFGLRKPPRAGGWVPADDYGGWTCCVEQGAYGHVARKATWLYAHSTALPELRWGKAPGPFVRLDRGYHSAAERVAAGGANGHRLSARQCEETPTAFRDELKRIVLAW